MSALGPGIAPTEVLHNTVGKQVLDGAQLESWDSSPALTTSLMRSATPLYHRGTRRIV